MPPRAPSPFPSACKSFASHLAGLWGGWDTAWNGRVGAIAVSPDGRLIAAGDREGAIKLLAPDGRWGDLGDLDGAVLSLAFSPDGRRLLVGGDRALENARLTLWSLEPGHEPRRLVADAPLADVTAGAFTPDGALILAASGENDGLLYVFDAATGACVRTLGEEGGAGLADMVVSADGRRVWLSGWREDTTLSAWDLASGERLHTFDGAHLDDSPRLALSPDGTRLLSVSPGSARLWDAATGALLAEGPGGWDGAFVGPEAVAVATLGGLFVGPLGPDMRPIPARPRRLAVWPGLSRVVCADAGLELWDLATGARAWSTAGAAPIAMVTFDPSGTEARWADRMGDLRRAPIPAAPFVAPLPPPLVTGTAPGFYPGEARHAQSAAFLSDGSALVLYANGALTQVDTDGRVRPLHAEAASVGSAVQGLEGNPSPLLATSADGALAVAPLLGLGPACMAVDGQGAPLPLPGQLFPLYVLAVSHDGRLALGGAGNGAKVWRLADGQEAVTLQDVALPVKAGVILPDGRRLLLAGYSTLGVWDLETGQRLVTWPAQATAVAAGGGRVFSAGPDGQIRAWNPETGAELAALDLKSAKDRIWALAVSPAGDRLLAGTAKGVVLLFNWPQ